MYPEPLGPQARRHFRRLIGALLIASLALAPPLWAQGAFGIFLWACLVLTGIIALGQREDALHAAQDSQRHTPDQAAGAAPSR
jgi:hypothetical protein